jgi:hypothetical protein
MNKIAEVKQFEHGTNGPQVTVDHGGGANKTAEHFGPAGEDSQPLPGDFASVGDARGSGREVVHGYADSKNQSKAKPGEVRRYARDLQGNVVSELWLKNDGSLSLLNKAGFGLTISKDGLVTIKGSKVVHESPDVRVGAGAGRAISLVGDLIGGTVAGAPLAAAILGPGSVTTKG